MGDEYDFSQGERGKYERRYARGTNVVVLEPDVAKISPNSKSVNVSLRKIIRQIDRVEIGAGEARGSGADHRPAVLQRHTESVGTADRAVTVDCCLRG